MLNTPTKAKLKSDMKSSSARVASSRSSSSPDSKHNQRAAELAKFYHDMLLIRRFEEKGAQLYGMGLIGGFCHLTIGQEAVSVGIYSAQEPQDTSVTSYRERGQLISCGADPRKIMAELLGRETGASRGKGGSMHIFEPDKGFYGGHGIVGAQVPIGTGLGFAHKYKGDNGVCITYLGDGAVNQGQTAESFNMAALWKLPVVYVIENNLYAMGTAVKRHAAGGPLFKRGEPYGIPGEQVDGMDVLKVQEAARRALAHARSGKGPYILEMMTYRYRGHSMSDPGKYRTKEEVEKWREECDPIDMLRDLMLKEGLATDETFNSIERDVKGVVAEATEYAQNSPEPDPSELFTDVLVGA